VIADVRDAEGRALAEELGPSCASYVHLDVRSEADWTAAIEFSTAIFGPPNVLLHNAGVMLAGPIESVSADLFRTAFDVNVLGAFLGTRAVIPAMQAAGGGSVIIMSSAAGMEGSPGMSAYGATKAANANFAKSAAVELGRHGMRVNCIAPGGVDTAMSNGEAFAKMDKAAYYGRLPVPRMGQVADVASIVLFLASDESAYITGAVIPVDGGRLAGRSVMTSDDRKKDPKAV
jgi:3alpha(or 20beta)-hydroxysteroid dehydrogenase